MTHCSPQTFFWNKLCSKIWALSVYKPHQFFNLLAEVIFIIEIPQHYFFAIQEQIQHCRMYVSYLIEVVYIAFLPHHAAVFHSQNLA